MTKKKYCPHCGRDLKAKRANKRRDDLEDQDILLYAKKGFTAAQIATDLDLTINQVRYRISELRRAGWLVKLKNGRPRKKS